MLKELKQSNWMQLYNIFLATAIAYVDLRPKNLLHIQILFSRIFMRRSPSTKEGAEKTLCSLNVAISEAIKPPRLDRAPVD